MTVSTCALRRFGYICYLLLRKDNWVYQGRPLQCLVCSHLDRRKIGGHTLEYHFLV